MGKLKVLVASLGLAALIGSDAAAASFKGLFNTTPFFTQFGGPADDPNDVVSMTVTDDGLGGVDMVFANIGSGASIGSVFIADIVESDFEGVGGTDFLTSTGNTYENELGRGVVFFSNSGDILPGGSSTFSTTALSSLSALDIAGKPIGVALVDPNAGSSSLSLAFYSGSFVPVNGAVPAPAALPLMLSVVGAFCFAARRRRRG